MADITSFLGEGAEIPAGSALTAVQTQTVLPEWYTNYAKDIIANQQAAATRPFTPFQGPRVAEFSPDQIRAFEATRGAAGAYQPGLSAATAATQGLLGANALGAAQPFFGRAAGMSGVGAAAPNLEQAAKLAAQSTTQGGLSVAQPYLTAAGGSTVGNIGAYMNPFQQQVVDQLGTLAQRNLSENIMPEIEGRYIKAGQLGFGARQPGMGTPSGMLTDTARAIRGTQEALLAEQSRALQAGYGEAAGLAGTDLSRQAQLAQTAGALGTAGQTATINAAQQLADIGKTYGGLTADQQKILAEIGAQTGAIGGADITRQLAAAQQMAQLGEMEQTLGLRGAGALGAVGQQIEGKAQKNIDTAYEDYLRQQGYPQAMIDAAVNTLKGVAVSGAIPGDTVKFGIEPVGGSQPIGPGKTASALGAATGLVAAINDIFGNKP